MRKRQTPEAGGPGLGMKTQKSWICPELLLHSLFSQFSLPSLCSWARLAHLQPCEVGGSPPGPQTLVPSLERPLLCPSAGKAPGRSRLLQGPPATLAPTAWLLARAGAAHPALRSQAEAEVPPREWGRNRSLPHRRTGAPWVGSFNTETLVFPGAQRASPLHLEADVKPGSPTN